MSKDQVRAELFEERRKIWTDTTWTPVKKICELWLNSFFCEKDEELHAESSTKEA